VKKYYNKFSDFLIQKYGQKVWKVSLDAGFSCPNCNEDGKEGCLFCRNDSFSLMGSSSRKSITQQMHEGMQFAQTKLNITKYIAYFQSSTNTFAPISQQKELFNQAISLDNVIGVSISTRPDCLPPKVLELIDELSKKVDVWIELGLQSIHNKTLDYINRGHTFEDYEQAVEKLKKLDVRICTHIMLGLPGETKNDVLHTAHAIAGNGTHDVKIHPLLIIKETQMADLFKVGKVHPLTMEEYVTMLVDFVEVLPPEMVMQRLTAESQNNLLIEPVWCINKLRVLNAINSEFQKRGTYQGAKYKSKN
jgi:radical SAM protein (TIGR01212 family)